MKKWNAPNSRGTCCSRAEFLAPNPTRSSETSVFTNSFLMKSLAFFLSIKPVLLTVERQFAFVYNDVLPRNQVQVFSLPLENLSLCNCVQTWKRSKPRVSPTQAFFPFEALGKTSSVTAPTVTWPALRKKSIVQAKEVYSKCLLGITDLVNRGQAWLKIAETSGDILSLL